MVRLIKKILIVFLCFSAKQSFAYTPKEGNLAIILGPTFYKTDFGGANPAFNQAYATGLGLIAVGDLNEHGGLEFSVFTLNKTFLRADEAGNYIAQKAEMLDITMGWRQWIDEMFSASISFFSAYPMGTPETIYSNIPFGEFVNTSASDKVEYGFEFAGQAELLHWEQFAFVTDVRYSWSVTPKEEEHGDHYGIMFGLRYMAIQKNDHTTKK
jgi:hypothetical protein